MSVWALVPARGGSKSIPVKNLVSVAGIPLLDYGVRAVQASGLVSRIICSTDHDGIAERAKELGIEVDRRPTALATDEAPVTEVAAELLGRLGCPDILILVQPTSPFLLPDHVRLLLEAMFHDPAARSGQTVAQCPHNHHAWNQREIRDGYVRFRFQAERAAAYNKQAKPKLFVFGNLVAVRPSALLSGQGFFSEPSVSIEIHPPYDFDLDVAGDVRVAEAMLMAGLVQLPHLDRAVRSTTSEE